MRIQRLVEPSESIIFNFPYPIHPGIHTLVNSFRGREGQQIHFKFYKNTTIDTRPVPYNTRNAIERQRENDLYDSVFRVPPSDIDSPILAWYSSQRRTDGVFGAPVPE